MWSSAVDSGLPETLICNLRGWRHWGHHPRVLVEYAATLPEPPSGCGLFVHHRLIEQWGFHPFKMLEPYVDLGVLQMVLSPTSSEMVISDSFSWHTFHCP
ncbi:hypothetical protein PVAP13_3NG236400 [Panicum virgatum]|uniref:Uncharacterized protein n=1 Tax=Panicum virgatum TaxID=38727 RepID=A0A8T0UH17_PANVG|nr:hypothetical protein PVAP13_3NG236400 [Panicum virgatum]